jgi:thioredoxin 1
MIKQTAEPSAQARTRDAIRTVTRATFAATVLQGEGPIAVEFMSYGCSHCGALEPAIQQVAEMSGEKGKIFRVNIAVEEDLAESYAIRATPTLVMFLSGTEVGRIEGPTPTVPALLTALTAPFRAAP